MSKKKKELRDDFTAKTIRLLRERVSDLCSKPDCRVSTRGASSEQEKSASIGVAAHITAAASGNGAARYDSNISSEQRKHYDNGIWLCQTCSRLIDIDEERFPVSLLKEWKKLAEDYSQCNIGKQLITKDESNKNALDMVIDYTIGSDHKILSTGVVDMLNHYDQKIKSLDPRFNIKTNVIDGCINRIITPLHGNIHLSMHMPEARGKEFSSKVKKLNTFGEEFEISADDITFKGSPLFEGISNNSGSGVKLKVMPPSIKMDCELFAINNESKQSLHTFTCQVIFAKDLTIIKGVALNKFIEFESRYSMSGVDSTFTYRFKTNEWIGKDIWKIPYFPKLKKALPILVRNGSLMLEITDSDYNVVEFGNTKVSSERSLIDEVVCLFEYIDMARIIAGRLNIDLTYQYFDASPEDMYQMSNLYSLINFPINMQGSEFDKNPKLPVEIEDIKQFENEQFFDSYGNFRIDEFIPLDTILSQQIPQPVVRQEFNDVKPKLSYDIDSKGAIINACIEFQFGNNGSYQKYLVS
ncbi:putative HNH endonuclease [Vibrio crassostreae]|uniref:hypothetical protein n=1 Tax=Vibrio crassostreae TaxID=246167 RepID=UPI0010455279|nr:hypothetical protein [Vibrio crassostreae]TCT63752.1 hypothetical protein EDB40_101244 [Vibrio crassostreae]CAK2016168.1 putative HNH endonuclease [Vibrio crassostreae]CAK2074584.1 putative HNH endonuclease [Vibrio crassostreae]CAK2087009.1 putative HNH endonuclease [Vibrio crassostreae]CAK2145086.1 putative HNH endonuclease [Vibrio crassostreae]